MTIYSTYKVKIKHYNHIFKDTISVYRAAVDYLIHVCIEDWDNITSYEKPLEKQRFVIKPRKAMVAILTIADGEIVVSEKLTKRMKSGN